MYKQFTYARNIIQYNINDLLDFSKGGNSGNYDGFRYRDTLLLQVYDVNFLYVLKAFTAKGSGLRDEFKKTAREMFRKNFIELLDNRYYFWAVFPEVAPDEKLQKLAREWNLVSSEK